MPEDEALLHALAQLERHRAREAAALREANALVAGLERMTKADGPREGLEALLDALRGALGCDTVAVLTPRGGDMVFAHRAGMPVTGWLPDAAAALGAVPLRCDDLRTAPWWPGEGVAGPDRSDAPPIAPTPGPGGTHEAAPEAPAFLAPTQAQPPIQPQPPIQTAALFPPATRPAVPTKIEADAPLRAWVSAPVPAEAGARSILACLSSRRAAFGDDDLRLVARFAGLAAQVLANHALAQRNALLAAVVDGASASVVIADVPAPHSGDHPAALSFPLVYVNHAFETLTGWSRADVIGRDCRFLSAEPEDSPERTRIRQVLQSDGRGRFVLRNRSRDGRLFWNELSLHPIHDAQGRIDKVVATQVDVTERMTAERDRDRARSRLINALSSLGEGFLLLDDRGRVVFANPPYRDFFAPGDAPWAPGRGFAEVWAARLEALGHPASEARREAGARLDAMRAGRVEREERLPDGRILLVTEQPAPDGGCMSMAVDVTRLKTSERMLAARAAAMDAAQDGISVVDEGGRIIYMNTAHRRMIGFDLDSDAVGKPWRDLYSPEQVDLFEQRIAPELTGRGAWRGEVRGRRPDGVSIEQELSLTLVQGVGAVCVSRDTSERRRAEVEQAKLRDQLHAAQRHEAIGVLAAGIAHDFNNLLSAITGSAAMIAGAADPASPERRHAERILAAGGRAADLVARLLVIGRRPAPLADSDLRAALDEAIDLVRAGLPSNIDLVIDAADTPMRAQLHATDFLQVLLNLVINARDAIGAAGGVITVMLDTAAAPAPGDGPTLPGDLSPPPPREAEPAAGSQARADPSADPLAGAPGLRLCAAPVGSACARLRVRDTGCGIPPDRIREIFEPYFTTKGGAGTGLGLSVLASLVQGAGGGLTLRSREGEGAEFEVLWPLHRTVEADPGEPVSPGSATSVRPASPIAPPSGASDGPTAFSADFGGDPAPASRLLAGALILVVDDDLASAETVGALLEAAGAEAAVCDHPDDALEALREDPCAWSLLVTDFEMPGLDGGQVAEAARRLAPGLPVVLCSGLGFDAARRAGRDGLFDAVLPKPIDPARLVAAVARAIFVRGAAEAGAAAPVLHAPVLPPGAVSPLSSTNSPPGPPPDSPDAASIPAPFPDEPIPAPRSRTETR